LTTTQSTEAISPEACAWCEHPLRAGAERLPGRIRCPACGVSTTDPWPTDRDLDQAYGSWYRPASGRFTGLGDAVLGWTRGRLARRLDRIAPPGRVLDVGAGDGTLLDALRRRGREAVGLERRSDRPDVVAGDIGDLDGDWAAVVFWHSLEHLRTPEWALRRAAGLVTTDGVMVVAAPNAASWQAQLFGERWFALDLPRHLVHIPAAVLVATLEGVGFRVERESYARGGQVVFGWLHGLVGLLPSNPDLYDAIRRPDARREPMAGTSRVATLAASALLLPAAGLAATAEILARRGGTVYVEARRV
jgi:SAM-dependent methyltransferase